MSFSGDLNRASVNIGKASNARIRKIALAAFAEIQKQSPVDKGTFRANWTVGIDTLDRSYDLSKVNASEAIQTAMAVIANGAKLGTSVFISNSVPYTIKLENGYSRQSPAGVVDPVMTRLKNKIEQGDL